MGDLGSDAAGSALSLGAKALEAIMQLINKIFEAWKSAPERELAKQRLKETKDEVERKKLLEKLDGKVGYVNYQKLKKSGMELQPIPLERSLTKEELKEFSALCKREGVLFTGLQRGESYELLCKKTDLEKVAGIVDRMNDEKMIVGIDKRIAELESKGERMTEQDKVDISHLQEQKAAIQKSYCTKLNDEMSKNVIDRAVTGEVKQNLTLDEALNRLTGRHLDKDIVCIVADANDPSKYIKCHGYQDTYKDEPYIKTEYEVYRDGQTVLKTHDGRFDNRPKDYWNEQKSAIQTAGDFSGTFFKFASVVEYQKWAEAVRNQNTQELTSMDKEGEKNYETIISELGTQLEKDGAKMQDGKVVDIKTGEPLKITEGMTEEQKAIIAEAMVIGKQIDNYTELSKLDTEISIAEANVFTAEAGTKDRAVAEENLAKVQEQYKGALEKETQLLKERKDINAVQAEQDVRNIPVQEQARSNEVEHPDDRRSDRVNEKDEKQMNMEEAKGQIEQARAKDGAKHNDTKDRQVHEQGTKAAIGKSSMTHTDR